MAGEPDPVDRREQRLGAGVVERSRPVAQAVRRQAHAVDADQGDDAAQGQHRAVAGDLRALDLCGVDRAQQLERQRQVGQQMRRDLVGALALDSRDPLHPRPEPGQRRQVADGAQAIEQERDRSAVVVGERLAPAVDGAEKGAGVAVAQPDLPGGAAIDDRPQRLGDRMRRGPRQAHELAAVRCQALDHLAGVGDAERRLVGEQAVQQQAAGEHVALGGAALRPQHRRVERHRPVVVAAGCGIERALVRHRERHHRDLAAFVDEQGVELRVEMGDTGVVGEGQGAQHLFDPERRLVGGRLGMLGQPLVERDAGAAIDDHDRATARGRRRRAPGRARGGRAGRRGARRPARRRSRRRPQARPGAGSASPRRRPASRRPARSSSPRSCRAGGAAGSGRTRAPALARRAGWRGQRRSAS